MWPDWRPTSRQGKRPGEEIPAFSFISRRREEVPTVNPDQGGEEVSPFGYFRNF